MMKAVVTGHDPDDVVSALRNADVDVSVVEGTANRDALADAGVTEADILVITDVGLATAIPVAKELNPDVRVVVYDRESVPEFARGQADLIVDPELMSPDTVVDGLV